MAKYFTQKAKGLIDNAKAKKEMNFKQLAEAMGVKDQYNIINYANGKRPVTVKTINKFANALELDADELSKETLEK